MVFHLEHFLIFRLVLVRFREGELGLVLLLLILVKFDNVFIKNFFELDVQQNILELENILIGDHSVVLSDPQYLVVLILHQIQSRILGDILLVKNPRVVVQESLLHWLSAVEGNFLSFDDQIELPCDDVLQIELSDFGILLSHLVLGVTLFVPLLEDGIDILDAFIYLGSLDIGFTDETLAEEIMAAAKKNEFAVSEFVQALVLSEAFQRK